LATIGPALCCSNQPTLELPHGATIAATKQTACRGANIKAVLSHRQTNFHAVCALGNADFPALGAYWTPVIAADWSTLWAANVTTHKAA